MLSAPTARRHGHACKTFNKYDPLVNHANSDEVFTSFPILLRLFQNSINFLKSNASKALDLLRPSDPNDLINNIKSSTNNFHIYTFGGLKETNSWLEKNNYV